MAINCGIDLVIELPTVYSISSSENFAYGAVGILDSLGIVDNISFASEIGSIEPLQNISKILFQEPESYKKNLNVALKSGISFPSARQIALESFLDIDKKFLDSPNNILGIEYIKALYKLNSPIIPFTLKRKAVEHSSNIPNYEYASATFLRNKISEGNFKEIKSYMPLNNFEILDALKNKEQLISSLQCFEKEILFVLRNMSIEEIGSIPDVSEGLEFLIKDSSNKTNKLEELIEMIKSKRYTRTRIQRILLYALLGISKTDMEYSKNIKNSYVRIIAMNENGKKLLTKLSNSVKLPVITSVKKALSAGFNNPMLLADINATNIYTLGYANNSIGNLDFTKRIEKK